MNERSRRVTRIAALAPLLAGLLGSMLTHGSAAIAILLHARGAEAGGGEGGHSGAGDTSIDVSLAGPTSTTPAEVPPTPPAPTQIESPPPTKTPPPPPPDEAPPTETAPTETAPTEADPPPPPPAAASALPPPGGGADATNGGKPAGQGPALLGLGITGDTIEGQRALLPKAATCKDSVAGKWEALKFNPARTEWVAFTLTIHHTGSSLSGTILSHTWLGTAFDRVPPACTPRSFDMTVSMNASGRDDGTGNITFGSRAYSIVAIKCWSPDSSYSPDNFSGHIDAARQEFQSLNNDGANDIDAPYVFRRTGCVDE